jgi:hypothetical protein
VLVSTAEGLLVVTIEALLPFDAAWTIWGGTQQ